MYVHVSNIFTHICHTLVPKIHVHHKMLCVFWYIYLLMCMITEKSKDRSHSLSAVKIIKEDRESDECVDTWYMWAETVEL